MKKEMYVTPVAIAVEIEHEMLMSASGNPTIGFTNDEASNEHDALSNSRRGDWGDLWE